MYYCLASCFTKYGEKLIETLLSNSSIMYCVSQQIHAMSCGCWINKYYFTNNQFFNQFIRPLAFSDTFKYFFCSFHIQNNYMYIYMKPTYNMLFCCMQCWSVSALQWITSFCLSDFRCLSVQVGLTWIHDFV